MMEGGIQEEDGSLAFSGISVNSTKVGNKKRVSRVLTVERGSTIQDKHIIRPGGFSLSCRRTVEISSYVDGELDQAEAAALQRHFDECRDCNRAYGNNLALRSSLRDSSLYFRTPLELKMRIKAFSQTDAEAEAARRPMLPW